MNDLAQVIEEEFADAIEKKNKDSLHRGLTLLMDNIAAKQDMDHQFAEVKSDIRILAETMKQGFEQVNKRFEAVDKRFEDMNKRFEDMNKRFEDMNKRFEDINKRFEDINKKLNIFMGLVGLWIAIFSTISLVVKFMK